MPKLEIENCTYLDNVSIDIAQQFQIDNPHVTVFFHGLLLDVAVERVRDRTACDYDPAKLARHAVVLMPQGTPAHLYAAKAGATIH